MFCFIILPAKNETQKNKSLSVNNLCEIQITQLASHNKISTAFSLAWRRGCTETNVLKKTSVVICAHRVVKFLRVDVDFAPINHTRYFSSRGES